LRTITYGAAQSGVCQINNAAGDRLEFPLTYQDPAVILASLRGMGFWVVGWAAAATAANVHAGIVAGGAGWPDVDMTSGVVDTGFDNSTTVHGVMFTYRWTQTSSNNIPAAERANLKMWVGQSTDAAPDAGVLMLMAEGCYSGAISRVTHQIGENDEWTATAHLDPHSSAVLRYTIASTDLTRGCTLQYSVDGVAQTDLVCAANTSAFVNINAPSFTSINATLVPADPPP
jgi:hypothetical protein